MSRKQAQLQLEQDPLIAKKPNIRTQWKPPTTGYEENSQPSLTIPDQTLSVTEILARHTRGQDISQFIRAIQHGDDQDLPDLARMDISERYDYIEATRIEIKRLQQQAAEEIRAARQKKLISTARIRKGYRSYLSRELNRSLPLSTGWETETNQSTNPIYPKKPPGLPAGPPGGKQMHSQSARISTKALIY